MEKQKLYKVTVLGTFTKEVRIYAEDEESALDFVQDICDNTDLISTADCDELELTAEDIEEIDDDITPEAAAAKIGPNETDACSESGKCAECKENASRGNGSGDVSADCGKDEKCRVPGNVPSSAGKEADALRRLSELLGGPFVGILID